MFVYLTKGNNSKCYGHCLEVSLLRSSVIRGHGHVMHAVGLFSQASTLRSITTLIICHVTDEVIECLRGFLERCLAAGTLTLKQLALVEDKVLEQFSFTNFQKFKIGTFLHCLNNAQQLQTVSAACTA